MSVQHGALAAMLAVGIFLGVGVLFLGIEMVSLFIGMDNEQTEGLGPADSAPLEDAAGMGDLQRVVELLRGGADPDEGVYMSPLMAAVDINPDNSVEVIQVLLDHGADVEFGGMEGSDQTPLHRAAMRDDREVVQLLLERGADPCREVSNTLRFSGMTALDIARSLGSTNAEQVLEDATQEC